MSSRHIALEGGVCAFWGDGSIRWRSGGWLQVTLGATRLLFCPSGGDAAELPPAWRNAHLVLFNGTPPRHATAIAASGGILCCGEEELAGVTKAVPWGIYPIRMTAEAPAAAATRGRGDLEFLPVILSG